MVHHFLLQILRVLKPFLTKRTRERYQRGQFTIIRLLLATNTKITLLINNSKTMSLSSQRMQFSKIDSYVSYQKRIHFRKCNKDNPIKNFYKKQRNIRALEAQANPQLLFQELAQTMVTSQTSGERLIVNNLNFMPPDCPRSLLTNINFRLEANKVGLICGVSGSGKSTLLQVIAGLQQETDGSIYLGHNPEPCNPLDRNKKVGLVFQFPERHFVGSSILQEMCFGWPRLPEYQKDRDVLFSRLKEVLHQVGLDTVNVYSSPLSLSGGYKRRLAMALQLVRRPSVLLLDEPLAGLDWKARKDVHSLLQSISNKCTILIVSHDLKELMPYCDQLWRMKEGGILVEEG
eukprot:TRINITY_DN1104_c0_g1_i3.p3 TRINITY_DN1104_c0_g1~~TRINITY_DN1104_c0_g1_i3.p3  ORF type:complete len:346 (+),score=32.41 TRINITY_DN1104_c0_g1_i3:34-1071(+)